VNVEALDPASYDDAIDGLGALLKDAVDGGASVNFLAGATAEETAGVVGVAGWRGRRRDDHGVRRA
jgi:hypothetical protein